MALDITEEIEKFKEFVELHYIKELHLLVSKGKKAFVVNFSELARFDPDLSEHLLRAPEEFFKIAEIAVEQFDLGRNLRVRFRNLPASEISPKAKKGSLWKAMFFIVKIKVQFDRFLFLTHN